MKKLFGRKTEVAFFILLLLYFIFFFNFLYEIILPQEVFPILKQKKDILKDWRISFVEIEGGLLSNLSFHNLSIAKEGKPSPVLHLPRMEINISLLKFVKGFIFNKNNSTFYISLYHPVVYIYERNFLPQLREGIISILDLKWPKIFTSLGFNKLLLKVKGEEFVSQNSDSEEIKFLDSLLIWNKRKLKLDNLNLKILNSSLQIGGFIDKPSQQTKLNIIAKSDSFKLFSLIKGDLSNPRVLCKMDLFEEYYGTIRGRIEFSEKKLFLEDIKITPTENFSDLFANKIGLIDFFLTFPFKKFFTTIFQIKDFYELKGNYNYVKKKAHLDVKKITFNNREENKTYFDNYRYSQLMKLNIDVSKFPQLNLTLNIERFITKQINYITNLYLEGNFFPKKEYLFKGKLHTEGTVLNYQPFKEIEVVFKINQNILKVEKFDLEDILYSTFDIALNSPYNINLKLNTSWINIGKLIGLYYPEFQSEFKGKGKMKLILEGKLFDPYITGNLVAKNGIMQQVDFMLISCSFEGDKNWITLHDSWMRQKDNVYDIYGKIRLGNIGSPRFLDKINLSSKKSALLGQGWSLLSKDGGERIKLKKQLNENFNIGFSTYLKRDDSQILGEVERGEEMELEYSLTEDKDLKLELREEEEFFGLQQTVEF